MKLSIVIGVFALAVLAYSQPLVDMVQQYNRPFPPVKKPLRPLNVKPIEQIDEPQPPVVIDEDYHAKPLVGIVEEYHATPPVATDEEYYATPPVAVDEEYHAIPPVAIDEENHVKSPAEVVEEIVQNIVNVIKHKPDIEYFNGKVVPTPKYPKAPKN